MYNHLHGSWVNTSNYSIDFLNYLYTAFICIYNAYINIFYHMNERQFWIGLPLPSYRPRPSPSPERTDTCAMVEKAAWYLLALPFRHGRSKWTKKTHFQKLKNFSES